MSDAHAPQQPPMKDFGPAQTSGKASFALVLGVLSLCFSFLASIPALILALMAMNDISNSEGRLKGTGLAVCGLVLAGIGTLSGCLMPALMLPAVQAAREAARRQASMNNMKQISLGLMNYEDVFRSMPLAGSNDPQHGIGLSWRVRLLPFINHQQLHDQFDYNEPWDSPHNLALAEQMPDIFRSPNHGGVGDNTTVYLGVSMPGEAIIKNRGVSTSFSPDPRFITKYSGVTDGLVNTVVFIEADSSEAVIWTKPDDWELELANVRRGIGNLRPGGFLAAFGDGAVRFLPNELDDEMLRRLFLKNDGQLVELAVP